MSIFEDIYSHNNWGFGSGHGSLPSVTRGYRQFLEMFLKENDIKSVVDYGCGDWQFSKLINWTGIDYTGVDVVETLMEQNARAYGTEHISFKAIKPGTASLPKADLLIVKDVLQHLPSEDVKRFTKTILPKYKYALITNCVIPTKDLNAEIAEGDFRPLDIRKTPFNVPGQVIFSFVGPKTFSKQKRRFFPSWKKNVILVTSSQ